MTAAQFLGFRRPDGSFGIRNHVAVIAAMDNVNPVVRRIAAGVRGTVPIWAAYGRGMFGEDEQQHDRTLVGYGAHPNVAATLVISMEPKSARALAERIGATGRPVAWLAVQNEGGTMKTVDRGQRLAMQMVVDAGRILREPVPISELCVGLECGASDATSGLTANSGTGLVADWIVGQGGTVVLSETEEAIGAEDILAKRALRPDIGQALLDAVRAREAEAHFIGADSIGFGPDNAAGGLTTLEEKSLGAVRKGGTTPLVQVVGYGERPSARGLVFMDAPAPGTENITALAAGGCQLILFNTGVGNPVGNPIAPTLKITGNPRTAEHFADNIDVDVGGVLTGQYGLPGAAERIREALEWVANGMMTRSEIIGDVEISISRIDIGYRRAVALMAVQAGKK
jgi:altronate dehydratase large subunit